MNRLKTAIHLHTDHSWDSNLPPRELVALASQQGFHVLAITDHDEVAGAMRARDAARESDPRIIVGEEISSAAGHVIGLFVERWIPPGLPLDETVARIREQGGVVLAPHAFGSLCEGSLMDELEPNLALFDAIEIFNAQNPFPWEDRAALAVAERHGKRIYAGADCHLRGSIAPAHQWLAEFDDAGGFLKALESADLVLGRFDAWYWARMGFRHYWDAVVPWPLPGFAANNRIYHKRGLFSRPRPLPAAELARITATPHSAAPPR